MSLTALQRYTFDVRGYLVIEGALDRREVAGLRRAVEGQRLPAPGEGIMEQRFGYDSALLAWDQAFRDLLDHPVALGVLAEMIGPYVRLDHAYGIMMRRRTAGLGLHGPNWPWDPCQYYLHRGGRAWNGLLSFAWSLTDARPGDGGFGCVPGSHLAAQPFPAGGEALTVEVPQRAGDLIVFTEALVHCTIPWQSRDDRYSLLYKYSPGSSTWTACPAAPPEALPHLTPRQRLLVEPPYVGGRQPVDFTS